LLLPGIGKALAAEFVRAGDNVIISSRSEERVRTTTRELQQLGSAKVAGIVANVSKPGDVAGLAKFAAEQLGTVDLWCARPELCEVIGKPIERSA
jgi:chlorophyll(ide) b reductase